MNDVTEMEKSLDKQRARITELEAELAGAIDAIKTHVALMSEANTRAERQTRRADSYARTAKACLRDAGPALVEARERAENAEARAKAANNELNHVIDERDDANDLVCKLRAVLEDLTFADDCQYDHHGFCQAHNWFKVEPRCPQVRAKEALGYADAAAESKVNGEGVRE